MIGLLLSALNPFKMILFWGLKKIPLLLEIPTLKDHLKKKQRKKEKKRKRDALPEGYTQEVLRSGSSRYGE